MTKIGVILSMHERGWRDIKEEISLSRWDLDDRDEFN
jgi:hypothetical protein